MASRNSVGVGSRHHARRKARTMSASAGASRLSRIRIAMARALLTEAPILIIDDGLSAVDSSTETHILKALQHYAEHKIVIIVSHRLSAVQFADKIITLKNGRIVESGTHSELLARNRYYTKTFRLQEIEEEIHAY